MMENATYYLNRKKTNKNELPICPYPDVIEKAYRHPHWLKPFDKYHRDQCRTINVLIENLPDNFNETSVYVLDMFEQTEDEIQDYLTQTMAVAFEGAQESGGASTDQKRLTYAWRLRHKLLYNADKFAAQSDFLMFWFIFFTLLSTWVAVVYTYFQLSKSSIVSESMDKLINDLLLKANLLAPLIATIIRGIFSILNPQVKNNALRDAAATIEAEIYMYRAKVGKYNPLRHTTITNSSDENNNSSTSLHPRVLFSTAVEDILSAATEGEVKASSLENPTNPSAILDEVNNRIKTNRVTQDAYLAPMPINNGGLLGLLTFGMVKSQAERNREKKIRSNNTSWSIFNCFQTKKITPSSSTTTTVTQTKTKKHDDGFSTLSAEEYVRLRMLPMLGEISSESPGLSSTVNSLSIIVSILSVASSALSSFNQSSFIPALLSFSGALQAWNSYQQNDQRLLQKNIAIRTITKVK